MEPAFYGDLVYKLKKNVGTGGFSARFVKIMSHHKKMVITLVSVLGGLSSHGWRLCFSLWLHAGGSGLELCDGSGFGTYHL